MNEYVRIIINAFISSCIVGTIFMMTLCVAAITTYITDIEFSDAWIWIWAIASMAIGYKFDFIEKKLLDNIGKQPLVKRVVNAKRDGRNG